MTEHPEIKVVKVRPDIKGEYRWTAYAHNGEAIAASSEGYSGESGFDNCVGAAKALFPDAEFELVKNPGESGEEARAE